METSQVIVDDSVRDTVVVHNLRTTQLDVGKIDILSEDLVEGGGASKNNGTLVLDGSLAKTDQVGTNTDGATWREGIRKVFWNQRQ